MARRKRGGLGVVGLPEYDWDPNLSGGRYRERATGKIVARQKIINLLRDSANRLQDDVEKLTLAFLRNEISAPVFEEAFQRLLKTGYNVSLALAKGGWDRVSPSDIGKSGSILRKEYEYLRGFIDQVLAGEVTEKQALMRARLYAGKAYSRYWDAQTERMTVAGKTEERWILGAGDERTCPDCINLSQMGWVPIGTLPSPGDGSTQCLGNCRDSKDYR